MRNTEHRAVAIVGLGAVLPDAPDVDTFWSNIEQGRYSISDVDPARWDPALFYDPDPRAPDKTYSRIGGWVRDFDWDPFRWKLPVPPTVTERMDIAQRWAISCTRAALADFGYPSRPLDADRTAVILGNAMGGELHYLTSFKIFFPEFARYLERAPSFSALPQEIREAIRAETHGGLATMAPDITEDTMPGELSNCIAGRIANLYNFHGPNYVTDAACASAMAAMSAAIEGLIEGHFDAVVSGGIDRNMGPSSFVKFCKIGALSARGTRPYADGADGFVMGEGAAIFLLKRLADAERDGDRVYAVIRGFGGSSDGKGKGITAPNPIGQKIAVRRGWENAGLSPATASLIEGHGTSTRVGDVVEVESLSEVFQEAGLTRGSVRLGSVKSNLGHLKGAAGAAGMLKAALALYHKRIPPSLNFDRPNPNIDFANSPFTVNTELEAWETPACGVRRAGVSAFGFGGTNFHAILEEHIPGMLSDRRVFQGADTAVSPTGNGGTVHPATVGAPGLDAAASKAASRDALRPPPSGLVVLGAASPAELRDRAQELRARAGTGELPFREAPAESDLRAPERLALDYEDADELAQKLDKALAALETGDARRWQLLASQGIFRGHGPPAKVAFLYTGQGSQYPNMLADLRAAEPIVAGVFDEADRVMTPLLGKPLSDYIFVDPTDKEAIAEATESLRQTTITQPAVLSVDTALTELLASWGMRPDMVMGHSLGEYGALVAAGALDFGHALEAVSARGREMERVSVGDNGAMAAVSAPIERIQEVLDSVDGYVVIANINSRSQAVIGGETAAIEKAVAALKENGMRSVPLSVSHAFHTRIVAPASTPLGDVLRRLGMRTPSLPVVSNVTGEFYPTGENALDQVFDLLGRQLAEPVQFVKGLDTLYDAGVRVFVETGPKRALTGFVQDVFGDRPDTLALYTNHPRLGDIASVNRCLCGLYAAGHGTGRTESLTPEVKVEAPITDQPVTPEPGTAPTPAPVPTITKSASPSPSPAFSPPPSPSPSADRVLEGARILADFLEKGLGLTEPARQVPAPAPRAEKRIVISGAGLGLPGTERVFDDSNLSRIMRGEVLIDAVPAAMQQGMVDKRVTRLIKRAEGDPTFEAITDTSDAIKLAGRGGRFDLVDEFGVNADRDAALNASTRLAMAAGIEALRDAGIPLVHNYRTTTRGTYLPERWQLPDALRDDTGVIFGCAFPGADTILGDASKYYTDRGRREELAGLESIRSQVASLADSTAVTADLDARIASLREAIERDEFLFNRRYLFRILAMGHSQFAEEIGARGPNTQINSACATTTVAISLAEDWIRAGRCRRVIIVAGDDVTRDDIVDWFGAGFLATGVAATDESVEDAALPFDRRRHGMLMGMGAAALVVEEARATAERGIRPICEVMSTVTANSAFHGTRLDIDHIGDVMETLVSTAERRWGVTRAELAPETVFVSHETYTPARGGSASAEVYALRKVFGDRADDVVIANTKGFTGHPMAVGIEDVIAVRILETGIVPPVPNLREIDPELGSLNLSRGGAYPVRYALRLGAGFGSQISMALLGWIPTPDGRRPGPDNLGFGTRTADPAVFRSWLSAVSGYPTTELEIDHRRLRIKDQGPPAVQPLQTPSAPGAVGIQEPIAAPFPLSATPTLPTPVLTQPLPTPAPARPAAGMAAPAPSVGEQRTAPAPVTAPPAEPGPAPAAAPVDSIEQAVLRIVSEQTGYPPDMLDMDLDLEADLGVDTVKQAETFAAVREAYGIERDDALKLRDYPTLSHVVQFVKERLPADALAAITATDAAAEPVAATLAAAPAAAASAAASTGPGDDAIRERVLAIVAEQTGYPPDMLDMDLDLEADLGVDTVKQAETFAAVRAAYGIERDDSLKLRDYPTLQHVVQFVKERLPAETLAALAPASVPVPAAAPASTAAVAPAGPAAVNAQTGDGAIRERVLAIVAEQTGYPPDMLDMDLDLEADLGVDTVKQAETFAAVRAAYGIERDESLKLRDYPTLNHVVQFVKERLPAELRAAMAPPVTEDAAREASPTGDAEIRERVLAIVAEQTGYPPDMLDMDLDLEADLGVDTVKQAETFAAVRAAYGIERDESLKLRDYPTLKHVVQFVKERLPAATASAAGTPAVDSPADSASASPVAAAPRRVPRPVLRPPLAQCKTTGVQLTEGSRVVVMPDGGGVGASLIDRLEKRGVDVLTLDPEMDAEAVTNRLGEWLADGGIHGVYWLPALDGDLPLGELDVDAWRAALDLRVKRLYASMRALYESVSGTGTFLVAGTRLGGLHGYDAEGAVNPTGGGVCGFVKAYARERPETLCKVVDFEPSRKTAALADILIDETLQDPGAVEIGIRNDLRWTVGLLEEAVGDGAGGLSLGPDRTFVVTGAAGSIVSAIVTDLARAARGGTFHLLDLAAEPDASNPDLEKFRTDPAGLRREIFERFKAAGDRATPAMVEKVIADLERAQSALAAMRAVQSAGGVARYHALDLRDGEAVARVIEEVRSESGRIDVLMHAAGLEISRFLPDKEPAEFDRVFDVKADGWFNLLRAAEGIPIGAAVVFSSIAGRFGNGGQTDYSAANDLLCKCVSGLRATRPETRGIAIDWTAWSGIGMASRGSIPKMMEAAGIDMLAPEIGIPVVRREVTSASADSEIVVAGSLGIMIEPRDGTGGLDTEAVTGPHGPMIGRVLGMGADGRLTVETELDPAAQPFLFDHQIDGTAVLPGVMGIEAFAELSLLPLPGFSVEAIEDVRFLAPFKFYRDEPRTVRLEARFSREDAAVIAQCALLGSRTLPGQPEPQVTTHFTARVRLAAAAEAAPETASVPDAGASVARAADIYRIYFHGPAYQVIDNAWIDGGESVAGRMTDGLPPNHEPGELPLRIAPRHVEACFQTAGLHELATAGTLGLPLAVERIRTLAPPPADGCHAIVRPRGDGGYDADIVDGLGNICLRLERYQTVALPGGPDAGALGALRSGLNGETG